MKQTLSEQIPHQYRTYGLMGGVALGLVSGVLVSGPHFLEWPVSRSLVLILCFVAGGALIGWTFLAIAIGFLGGGFATSSELLHGEDQLDDERRARSAMGDSDV
jgi:hypothetical protein